MAAVASRFNKAWDYVVSWTKVAFGFQPITKPRLDQILGNQLCPPLDMQSFRLFLTHRERTYENLSFYEFMVAYWILWSQLTPDEHRLSPPVLGRHSDPRQLPSFPKLDITVPTEQPITLDHVRIGSELKGFEPLCVDQEVCQQDMVPCYPSPEVARIKQDTTTDEFRQLLLNYCRETPTKSHRFSQFSRQYTDLSFQQILMGDHSEVPVRTERPIDRLRRTMESQDRPLHDVVLAAIEHFFVAGGSEEINVTEKARRQLFEDAAKTTHPSIFEPVYGEVIKMLSNTATGSFSWWSVRNISRQELIFRGYFIIFTLILIALMLFTFIYCEVSRWWRLWTLPFLFSIVMYLVTNTRGVCGFHILIQDRDKRMWDELKARSTRSSSIRSKTSSKTPSSTSLVSDDTTCPEQEDYPTPLLAYFLVDFDQRKPLKTKTSTYHTRKAIIEDDQAPIDLNESSTNLESNWSKLEEPLVYKGQLEILYGSLVTSFWIILGVEGIFVAIF
ncbi:hypothetical protein H4R35_005722 [Dimargaris xerosporica]|nr:hypothetical protein H4R35_005722 [Dimargaris xerosporica]